MSIPSKHSACRLSEQKTRRPGVFDRIELAWSTGRHFDGIWIGSWRTPEDLRRIEAALLLIKQHSRIHYSRVIRSLARVWVRVLTGARAEYDDPLRACVMDERYVASARLEQLASTIVHETTHARLARCGFVYEESMRSRIEAVCVRRERDFAAKLPDSAELQHEIERILEWCRANPEGFSNKQFRERDNQGAIDALRYVETPEWLIALALKLRPVISRMRRLLRSFR